jgi:uncharacterized protein (DUF1800 family)
MINPISGLLGTDRCAHLLRRVTFGITPELVFQYSQMNIEQAMNSLLTADISNDKPIYTDGTNISFLDVAYSQPTATVNSFQWVQDFWLNKMLKDDTAFYSIVLFWNNHFAISAANGQHYIRGFKYYKLLQQYALGNFRQFIIAMTKDPLMLDWLDGHDNQKGLNNIPSNENYARELQELFMIGANKPDGTPNYTETDVREAARVLTGWRIVNGNGSLDTLSSTFSLSRHDIGNKIFSSYYQNKVIVGENNIATGDRELLELINMILAQPECAKFICRKLYQWFVGAKVTVEIEQDIIVPLSNTFRNNDFEIKPVIKQLLSSQHFFDSANRGSYIKHPLQFILGMYRIVDMPLADMNSNPSSFYATIHRAIRTPADNMQMDILRHETVFGWDAFYQPDMYKLWINSTSLRFRKTQIDLMINGFSANGTRISFSAIVFTEKLLLAIGYSFENKSFPNVNDQKLADKIIEQYCFYFIPYSCTKAEMDTLKENLLFQGQLNEIGFWFEWKYYFEGDLIAKNGLQQKLNNALTFFWNSPEFNLC